MGKKLKVEDENLYSIMMNLFIMTTVVMLLNTIVRTWQEGKQTQNMILVPMGCLTFVLIGVKRQIIGRLIEKGTMPSFTLNLG